MMKRLSLIVIVLLPFVAVGQGVYNEEMVRPGITLEAFKSWAGSMDQWHGGDLVVGTINDNGYEHYYVLEESSVKDRIYHTSRYWYFFKEEKCFQIRIEPTSFDNIEAVLSRDHTFKRKEQLPNNSTSVIYQASSGHEVVLTTKTISVRGEQKQERTLWVNE